MSDYDSTAIPSKPGRATSISLSGSALRHNLDVVRRHAPGSRIIAAVKANGYGHGLQGVAQQLAAAQVDAFGVACLGEALALRQAEFSQPIVLLEGFYSASELPLIEQHQLQCLIHHESQLAMLEREAPRQVDVWIKVDTGMHRLGFAPDRVAQVHQRLSALDGITVHGFMTHLARADEPENPMTAMQLHQFERAIGELPGERAIANSAGVLGWPSTHADWVRPGIMLYGVSPFVGGRGGEHELKPVMTFRSELIAVNDIAAGESVGYGSTWSSQRPTRVGVVAVGYGDGYPRHAPSGTPVLVNGQRVPLIGRVSMDMITVDVTDIATPLVGDEVILWGEGLPCEEIADKSGTIAYELFCGITNRVWRQAWQE